MTTTPSTLPYFSSTHNQTLTVWSPCQVGQQAQENLFEISPRYSWLPVFLLYFMHFMPHVPHYFRYNLKFIPWRHLSLCYCSPHQLFVAKCKFQSQFFSFTFNFPIFQFQKSPSETVLGFLNNIHKYNHLHLEHELPVLHHGDWHVRSLYWQKKEIHRLRPSARGGQAWYQGSLASFYGIWLVSDA